MEIEVFTIKTSGDGDVWNSIDKARKRFIKGKKTTWVWAARAFLITFHKGSGFWETAFTEGNWKNKGNSEWYARHFTKLFMYHRSYSSKQPHEIHCLFPIFKCGSKAEVWSLLWQGYTASKPWSWDSDSSHLIPTPTLIIIVWDLFM